METIDLASYTLLATGYSHTAYTIDSSEATDTGNSSVANLATLTNLAAMAVGLDSRVIFAIESMESNFGTAPSTGTNIMQACSSSTSCSTVLEALVTGCTTLKTKLTEEGTYPLAASYYNCGVGGDGSQCSGTVISPYGAAAIFLAFQASFSGTLTNGYRGFTPSGSGGTANVMQTAGPGGNCSNAGDLCGNSVFYFGGGCVQISDMS